MKIDKTLKITIEQADVELAIRNLIRDEDPTIIVDEIVFAAKRNGKDSISIKVDAHFGDVGEETAPTVEETTEVTVEKIPELTDEEEAPFDTEDATEAPEQEETAESEKEEEAGLALPKQSLFG